MGLQLSTPILVVDDLRAVVTIVRGLLRQLGFENVDDAGDGAAALGKLKQKKYGLVICDWSMAPMTGYELLRQMRTDANLRATPFIMASAEPRMENVIAAKKAGASNYILKPFNAQTLKAKIAGVCG
ncbi:MAG: Chemotaxis regulator - transmits chemoreceptor signals to flagellar motor components CheY [uncultured Microvirga sp.]|uniref:Chemotaxis regulator - transmits chemoreceptor signals to flagellar motor components CheY n=1 Tax=uncultured Microvirga sp. TaxID=412392 RepID=A0A6J4LL18_9HYPH|nr:MAG: Chemotaxis regulator - transmits chemoreceptor signals to flagellar motor components CheY [uncultured Microvirga sp.]